MGARRFGVVYVKHGVAVGSEVVGDQHAMAAEIDPLGAHDGGATLCCVVKQVGDGVGRSHR